MIRKLSLRLLNGKIAFSTIVQLVGKFIQIFIAAATLKVISNYLSHGDYGIYASIAEYSLFFSVVANLGIFGNTVREMSKAPKDGKVFLNALLLRMITAGMFFVSAIIYLLISGFDAVFIVGASLFCSALFFDYVTSVCDGMLQANYLMGRASFALVAGRIVQFGMIILVTQYFAPVQTTISTSATDIPLLFFATICGSLFTAGLSLFFVSQKIEWKWRIDKKFMMDLLIISLPFGIINIFNNLYFRFLPDYFSRGVLSNEEFATFNISFKIAQVLSLFSTFLMFSVLPGFKQYLEQKDWNKAKKLFKWVMILLSVCGVMLVVGGSLLGPFALELLTHKKYFLPEFWFILPLMLLLAAISYGYDLMLITLFALNKDVWFLKRELIALLLAGILFASSFFVDSIQFKIVLIILGAIVGESFMVVRGFFKIREIFSKN